MGKKLLCIVGKTCSGKDTVAKIMEGYGVARIVSYSTAPRRKDQVEGVHHYFISADEMQELLAKGDVIAYTKFPVTGYEYCATVESIKGDVASYVIDPAGVKYLREKYPDIAMSVIYVDVPSDVVARRAKLRGDSGSMVEDRIRSEEGVFDSFRDSGGYNYLLGNEGSEVELGVQVRSILGREGLLGGDFIVAASELDRLRDEAGMVADNIAYLQHMYGGAKFLRAVDLNNAAYVADFVFDYGIGKFMQVDSSFDDECRKYEMLYLLERNAEYLLQVYEGQ